VSRRPSPARRFGSPRYWCSLEWRLPLTLGAPRHRPHRRRLRRGHRNDATIAWPGCTALEVGRGIRNDGLRVDGARRSSAAGACLEAARLSVTGRVLDLAFWTRVAFYAYQAAEQTLDFRRTIVSALGAAFEISQRLHQAGNVTELTRANDRALYDEARVSFTEAEANLMARREELDAQRGLWAPRAASWRLRDGLQPPADDPETFKTSSLGRSKAVSTCSSVASASHLLPRQPTYAGSPVGIPS
jgi:hypothetical protein